MHPLSADPAFCVRPADTGFCILYPRTRHFACEKWWGPAFCVRFMISCFRNHEIMNHSQREMALLKGSDRSLSKTRNHESGRTLFFCARLIAHKTKHCEDCGILANDFKCVPAFFEARSHLRCSLFEFYTAISSILSTFERLRFAVFEKCTLFEFHTAISSILSTLGS